jgi:replicative DNA helicase
MTPYLPDRMPEDLEAEKMLLATLAGDFGLGHETDGAHTAMLSCMPEYFVKPQHRLIFESMLRLYHSKQEISIIFVKADMEKYGTFDHAGGFTEISEVFSAMEVADPMPLVAILEDAYKRRILLNISAGIQTKAISGMVPTEDLISAAGQMLSGLSQGSTGAKTEDCAAIVPRLMAGEPFVEPGANSGKLAWLGLPEFDRAIEASAEHVITIAARPGIGKTALAIQTQWMTALNGIPSLLISLEMNRDELHGRVAAWKTGCEYRAFRDGRWNEWATNHLNEHVNTLAMMRYWVHPSGVPWAKAEAAIRESVRQHGTRVVLIDHLLLLQKPNLGKNANDAACWTAISRNIKRLAQELKICFVNLCQLNRAGDGVEPKLSDLKETGGWEEDANAVVLLYPKDPKAQTQIGGIKEVFGKAAKVRSGASGWKRLLEFDGAKSRFKEAKYGASPEPEPVAESLGYL